MGCGQSKQETDQELNKALERIQEKEKVLDELIKHHQKMNEMSNQISQQQNGIQKESSITLYKQILIERLDKLEVKIDTLNKDTARYSNQNGNGGQNNGQGSSKSPSLVRKLSAHNNNVILQTEDNQFKSKDRISTPPLQLSPMQKTSQHNQLPNSQAQMHKSQRSSSSQHQQLQNQHSLHSQQQHQLVQQQSQLINQQTHQTSQHANSKYKKRPSKGMREESESGLASSKRISLGQNGKILKKSSKSAAEQIEDEMQNWNNLICALDDISIRQIDQQQDIPPVNQNQIHLEIFENDNNSSQHCKAVKQKFSSNNSVKTPNNSQPGSAIIQSKTSAQSSKDITVVSSHPNRAHAISSN